MITDRDKTYRAVMLLGRTTDTQDISGQILSEKEVCVGEDDILARLYAELFHSGSGEDALAGLRDGSLIAHEQYVPFASGTGVQTTAVVFVGGLRLDLSGKLARMRDDEPHAVILAYFSKPVRFQGLLCTGQDFQIDGILKQAVLESLHDAVFQTEKQQQRRGDSGHGQYHAKAHAPFVADIGERQLRYYAGVGGSGQFAREITFIAHASPRSRSR